jgi:hypothetical protein
MLQIPQEMHTTQREKLKGVQHGWKSQAVFVENRSFSITATQRNRNPVSNFDPYLCFREKIEPYAWSFKISKKS